MAAGTSAVGYARMPGNATMIPAPKEGIEFLASSHFTIAQDNSATKDTLKSIFMKDYTPHNITGKPAGSIPPPPADVLQKDDRYFNEKASETVQAYEYRYLAKPELRDAHAKLSATNFKMDRDLSKFDVFHTSHNIEYSPKHAEKSPGAVPVNDRMKSFIPQGDQGKAPQPISDYRDRYRGHDANTDSPKRALSMHQHGGPTITGDSRQHHFDTTHNDQFKGVSFPKLTPFPAPVGTNIPQGDPQKESVLQSTQQASFVAMPSAELKVYDKNAVMGKLQQTTFKQSDGHGAWDTYLSTAVDSYKPVHGEVVRGGPLHHRNHSDFPAGDMDPSRVSDRVNLTTSRFYHGDRPNMRKPKIEYGANKRTKSNVWFGEPRLGKTYYDTTMETNFMPTSVPYSYHRYHLNTKSSVPMDYHAGEKTNPTTWSDFQNPQQSKLIPNPTAINNLKRSHIVLPTSGNQQFNTEHVDQYTPKQTGRGIIDPGKLQRSSVPLGTLQI